MLLSMDSSFARARSARSPDTDDTFQRCSDTSKKRQADRRVSYRAGKPRILSESRMIGGFLGVLSLVAAAVGPTEMWMTLGALTIVWSAAAEANLSR